MVAGKLCPVIEGDGAAQRVGHGAEHPDERAGDGIGLEAVLAQGDGQARSALVGDDDGVAGLREEHGIGLPMPGFAAGSDMGRPLVDRGARAARPAAFGAPAALVFGARQVMTPAPVVGALELGMDEAVDRLVADDRVAGLAGKAAGDLLG